MFFFVFFCFLDVSVSSKCVFVLFRLESQQRFSKVCRNINASDIIFIRHSSACPPARRPPPPSPSLLRSLITQQTLKIKQVVEIEESKTRRGHFLYQWENGRGGVCYGWISSLVLSVQTQMELSAGLWMTYEASRSFKHVLSSITIYLFNRSCVEIMRWKKEISKKKMLLFKFLQSKYLEKLLFIRTTNI